MNNLSQDIEQITKTLVHEAVEGHQLGEYSLEQQALDEATSALTQLFNKRLEAELRKVQKQIASYYKLPEFSKHQTGIIYAEAEVKKAIAQLKEAQQ